MYVTKQSQHGAVGLRQLVPNTTRADIDPSFANKFIIIFLVNVANISQHGTVRFM